LGTYAANTLLCLSVMWLGFLAGKDL